MEKNEREQVSGPGVPRHAGDSQSLSAPASSLLSIQRRLARRNQYLGGAVSLDALEGALDDPDWSVRSAVFKSAGVHNEQDRLDLIRRGLVDTHPLVRMAATRALGELREAFPVDLLIDPLKDPDWQVREIAILTIARLEPARRAALGDVGLLLKNALHDEDSLVRTAALEVLQQNYPAVWQQYVAEEQMLTGSYKNLSGIETSLPEPALLHDKRNGTEEIPMSNTPHPQPGPEFVPENSAGQMRSAQERRPRRRISRRTAIVSTGTVVVATAAAASYLFFLDSPHQGSTNTGSPATGATPTPAATSTPTPEPPTPTPTLEPPTPTPTPVTTSQSFGHIITTYTGQKQQVNDARWSPDGTLVASASDDRTVQIWHAQNGALLGTYRGHKDVVNSVDWSPDGRSLVSGGGLVADNPGTRDYSVQIWSSTTLSLVHKLTGPQDYIKPVRWSPNGQYVLAASEDGKAYVWNASTGGLVTTYTGHRDAVTCAAWSPDSQFVATGSADATVQVWHATTGTRTLTYTGHSSAGLVLSVAWAADGLLVASGDNEALVKVWKPTNGQTLFTYTGHANQNTGAAFRRVPASTIKDSWQVLTGWLAGKTLGPLLPRRALSGSGIGVFSLAWSPDSRFVASGGGSGDGSVQLWSPITHRLLYKFADGLNIENSVEWSPNGQTVASTTGETTTVWSAPA